MLLIISTNLDYFNLTNKEPFKLCESSSKSQKSIVSHLFLISQKTENFDFNIYLNQYIY